MIKYPTIKKHHGTNYAGGGDEDHVYAFSSEKLRDIAFAHLLSFEKQGKDDDFEQAEDGSFKIYYKDYSDEYSKGEIVIMEETDNVHLYRMEIIPEDSLKYFRLPPIENTNLYIG